MKVLFAVSNEKISEQIVKRYQREYKKILTYKNVYYFNAIIKELQRDKSYDRIVISEDLEPFTSTNNSTIDKFIFEKLDTISDEAQDMEGKDTEIILICSEKRTKNSSLLLKLFSIGIYNALIEKDRSIEQVCNLINRPRAKKEAKIYYGIDSDDARYKAESDSEVSEVEIQNILLHFKKISKNPEKFSNSFDNIASQYTEEQLKIIVNCLPIRVKAVLERESDAYRKVAKNKINYLNNLSNSDKLEKTLSGEEGIKVNNIGTVNPIKSNKEIVIPSAIKKNEKKRVVITNKSNSERKNTIQVKKEEIIERKVNQEPRKQEVIERKINQEPKKQEVIERKVIQESKKEEKNTNKIISEKNRLELESVKDEILKDKNNSKEKLENSMEEPIVNEVKKGRGRPRKYPVSTEVKPKGKRGRPKKLLPNIEENEIKDINNEIDTEESLFSVENEKKKIAFENKGKINLTEIKDTKDGDEYILPSFEDDEEEEMVLPSFEDEDEEEIELPSFEDDDEEEMELPSFEDEDEEEMELPSFEDEDEDEEEMELPSFEEDDDEEMALPSFEDEDEEEMELPSFEDEDEDEEEMELPSFEDEDEEEMELSSFEDEDEEEIELPSFEEDDEEEMELPSFEDEDEEEMDLSSFEDEDEEEMELPSFEEDDDEEMELPSFEDEDEDEMDLPTFEEDEEESVIPAYKESVKENVSDNLYRKNQGNRVPSIKSEVNYSMSVLNSLMTKDKKIVNFLGTSKNGTSFLVNNLAAIFDSMGINTAILDMTKNKNSYYIYTNNEERLRKIAHKSINNLKNGFAEGLKVGKNLTVYTSVPSEEIDESNAEAILSTLVQNHSLILVDCDYDTDPAYFAMCQELYLVQSMDVLTIQPLTKFLRDLKTKGVLDSEKIRVVINKELKMRTIISKDIIGGLSFYNDPSMSFMTDLFNKDLVKACTIPFDENVYSRYLDGVAVCKISISGYSKNFMSKMKILAEMVYPRLPQGNYQYNKKNTNYGGNSFSPNVNNTLEQMRKKY